MLFFSQMLQPPHQKSGKRTFWAIFWVGLGGLLGWPFAAAVGLPFALEELLIHSSTHSRKKTVRFRDWRRTRFIRLMATSIMVLVKILVGRWPLDAPIAHVLSSYHVHRMAQGSHMSTVQRLTMVSTLFSLAGIGSYCSH